MNILTMQALIEAITYKPGWSIYFEIDEAGLPYVQIGVDATTEASLDSTKRDGTRTPWRGSRRYLSPAMCRQEIVGAVFGLIKDAESHEMREWFRFMGASIHNPHIDPLALVAVARKASNFDLRDNAMSMVEDKPMYDLDEDEEQV